MIRNPSWCFSRCAAAAALPALGAARAQCVAVPTDTPSLGALSSAPFGNNNPTDPIFSDLRYQVLVPRALLGRAAGQRSRELRLGDRAAAAP